jgi:hypothetical protein
MKKRAETGKKLKRKHCKKKNDIGPFFHCIIWKQYFGKRHKESALSTLSVCSSLEV